MKSFTFIFTLLILITVGAKTQVPAEAFKYQTIVRDISGDAIINQGVSFRISILEDSAAGTAAYVETHGATTNSIGLVNLEIGKGIPVTGTFAGIGWPDHDHFIKVEFDATGGTSYSLMGTSQLLSVPYALHAKTAESALSIAAGAIDAASIADGSVSNAEFQNLDGVFSPVVDVNSSQTMTNKTLTDASTYVQDNVDHTKKMQFQLSGISAGNTRTLDMPDANTTLVGTNVTQTLTNKTIDANNNTITNISNTNIKVGASINASKMADGSVSNVEFQFLTGVFSQVVDVNSSQTMTNKTLTDASTYVQDNVDHTKKMQFQLSGITTGNTRTLNVPDANTTLVGTDVTQTLTNKTIDANNNTLLNFDKSQVGLGNVENLKVKLDATNPPASPDDANGGFSIGSRWIDTTNNKEYVCLDATPMEADWVETTNNFITGGAKNFFGNDVPDSISCCIQGTTDQLEGMNRAPVEGDQWIDLESADVYIFQDGIWIQVLYPGAKNFFGIVPDSISCCIEGSTNPLEGMNRAPVEGDQWINAYSNEVYIFRDGIWIEVLRISAKTFFGSIMNDSIILGIEGSNMPLDGMDRNPVQGDQWINVENADVYIFQYGVWALMPFHTAEQIGLGNVENLKVKLDATNPPASMDDSYAGFSVGSRWIDITGDKEYVCVDATPGMAEWKETTGGGSGGANYIGTSNTTVNLSAITSCNFYVGCADGLVSMVTNEVLSYSPGMRVLFSNSGSNYFVGVVQSYDGSNMVVDVDIAIDSTGGYPAVTLSDWDINLGPSTPGIPGELGQGYGGASYSTNTIATGPMAFNLVGPFYAYQVGLRVRFAHSDTTYVEGQVISYDNFGSMQMIINVDNFAGSGTYSTWNVGIAGDPGTITHVEVSATTPASTMSTAYAVVDGMTDTPAAGTYLVTFSSSGNQSLGVLLNYGIFSGGTLIAHSKRSFGGGGIDTQNFDAVLHTQAVVTVNGMETIDIRYQINATGEFTVFERSMILLKL